MMGYSPHQLFSRSVAPEVPKSSGRPGRGWRARNHRANWGEIAGGMGLVYHNACSRKLLC